MATVRVERRLSAILAADIVGYSRLMEADEAGTLAAIRTLRQEVLDPLLAEHKGRIVKLMGDGAIVEFASVVDAVACAVALQKEVSVNQKDVPPDRRIAFRVGINLGDVVVEGDDLFGDGVNIAARLEALAEPGGICISDAVQRQLAGKTDLRLRRCRRAATEEHRAAGAGVALGHGAGSGCAVRRAAALCPTGRRSPSFPSTI